MTRLKKFICWFFIVNGVFFILLVVLSFTSLPFWMIYDLSYTDSKISGEPKYIVVMSGGSIPSESGLMRTFKASEVAKQFPSANIIVTMPGDTTDPNSSSCLMKKEIVIRGIDENRIFFENIGTNTRYQIMEIKKMIPQNSPIILVSSPEHIYRSIKCFHKVGITNIVGAPAFHKELEVDYSFNDDNLGGNTSVPNIGKNIQFRYQFWNHLKYQVTAYREYLAICFYKLRGWI